MKIAVSSTGPGPADPLDPRLGRGMGCGRGMDGGEERGVGMQAVGGTNPSASPRSTGPSGGAGEVPALRQEVQQITRQLDGILQRLSGLEKA